MDTAARLHVVAGLRLSAGFAMRRARWDRRVLTGRSGGLRRGVGVDVLHLAGAHDAVKRAARELRSRTEGHALHDAAHDAAHHAAATLLGHGGRSGRGGHGRRWGRSRAAGGRRRRATHRLRRLRDAWFRGGLARGGPRGSGASRGWHVARPVLASLGVRSDSVERAGVLEQNILLFLFLRWLQKKLVANFRVRPCGIQRCRASGMVFTVLGSLYGPEGPPGADKSGGGTCWNKMFNGGRCSACAVCVVPGHLLKRHDACAALCLTAAVGVCLRTCMGDSCPHLRDAAIYKKSLKKINELHYQLWTWGG